MILLSSKIFTVPRHNSIPLGCPNIVSICLNTVTAFSSASVDHLVPSNMILVLIKYLNRVYCLTSPWESGLHIFFKRMFISSVGQSKLKKFQLILSALCGNRSGGTGGCLVTLNHRYLPTSGWQ